MANLVEMGILETSITKIITTKIMEINKEGIYMKFFYCQKKGHQINDCPLWNQHFKNEKKKFQPKVRVNVAIVEWCIPIILAFVAT
jgi:hypothetical protein